MIKKERVFVYIDGFNLYFGIKSQYPNLKWLNVRLMAQNLLKPHQELTGVKYFTSLVSNDPPKEKRQRDYISALNTTNIEIIYGKYKSKPKSCRSCGHVWNVNEEKMTDVNIAVNIIQDAMDDIFDTAMLISGDSDLVPPIDTIHEKFPLKRVMVAFPPNRHNESIKKASKGNIVIRKPILKKSQFIQTIILPDGYELKKPSKW